MQPSGAPRTGRCHAVGSGDAVFIEVIVTMIATTALPIARSISVSRYFFLYHLPGGWSGY